jgi:hypothetical protein
MKKTLKAKTNMSRGSKMTSWLWSAKIRIIVPALVLVGGSVFVGINYFGVSHAASYHYFWAGQSRDVEAFPSTQYLGYDTVWAGWHDVNYQVKCTGPYSAKYYNGYWNNWWVRLTYHRLYDGSGGWVNGVFLSGGGNWQPVPGVPIQYKSC